MFYAEFGVVVDKSDDVYGMEISCGTYGGTVWQFTGFSGGFSP